MKGGGGGGGVPFVPLVAMVFRDLSHSWLGFTWACVERRGGLSKESPASLILPPPQRLERGVGAKKQNKTKKTGLIININLSFWKGI